MKKNNEVVYPSGVYVLENVTKHIFYIGSSLDLDRRHKSHISALRRNGHQVKEIQNDYNNGDYFIFGIIKYVYPDSRQLKTEEAYFIRQAIQNDVALYNHDNMFNSQPYISKRVLKDKIVNNFCIEHYGRTFDQLFGAGNAAKVNMYYDFLEDPGKEEEIRKEYDPLISYVYKTYHNIGVAFRKENKKIS